MAKVMTRRTKPKAAPILPVRAPEPETTLGKEPVNVATKTAPLLGKCIKCQVMPAHSSNDHLCYDCHKTAAGYYYDGEKNLYLKKKKEKQ